MVQELITKNSVIKAVEAVRRKPKAQWPTIWPFLILYVIEAACFYDPTLVWPKVTYIIWNTYIDFFHSVLLPMTAFVQIFFSLLTVWQMGFTVSILYNREPARILHQAAKASGDHASIRRAEASLLGMHIVVYTNPHKGQSEIVPVQTRTYIGDDGLPQLEVFFDFQHRKWILDAEKGQFVKPLFPTRLPMKEYVKKSGIRSEKDRQKAIDSFGTNEILMEIPDFFTLLVDHAMAPFFVFQMFCVFLWCLDEYWMYSIFTGAMMVMMECVQVMQRRKNMANMHAMGEQPKIQVWTYRCNKWQQLDNRQLLPMDVIMLPTNSPSPCDTVVIRGTAVCNEAMLTGESTPQLKEAVSASESTELDMESHTRHLVFGGTNVLLSSGPSALETSSSSPTSSAASSDIPKPPASAGDGALAVVLRVGFETKQGKLVRTILHSQSRVSENSAEAFLFIGFLLLFAIAAVTYLLNRGLNDATRSKSKLLLHCIQVLTAVVPPELPMELTLAVNSSLLSLIKNRIFCTEPFRIPFAGKVDTCCFDKTGTLTTDEMLFTGVDRVDGVKLRTKLENIEMDVEEVLAGCHSLVMIDSVLAQGGQAPPPVNGSNVNDPNKPKELSGDAMEKAAVETLNWTMIGDELVRQDIKKQKKNNVTPSSSSNTPSAPAARPGKKMPPTAVATTGQAASNPEFEVTDRTVRGVRPRLKILHRFPFNPALRRMSCVVRSDNGAKSIVVKGSPESLRPLLSACPSDYESTAIRYAKKGFRVIALARKELPGRVNDLSSMSREDAESDLLFMGFAIFQCPLKSDSVATIQNLLHGSHDCVIITGDAIDTAVAVAKDVGIFSRSRPVEIVNKDLKVEILDDAEPDEKLLANSKSKSGGKKKKTMTSDQQLCVNTEWLTNSPEEDFKNVVQKYGEKVAVWSRCAPNQKEQVVAFLKSKGRTVLMAGDGTNDVGGLKQAHVGIAVLNCTMVANSAEGQAAKQGGSNVVDPLANFKITPMPPPIRDDAPFGERLQYSMQVAKHQAETKRKAQMEKMLEKQREERGKSSQKFLEQANALGDGGEVAAPKNPLEGLSMNSDDPMSLASSMFNDMDDGMGAPTVKLGDASIAAPFTCKSKNMSSVVDVVRQGRCTLVTTLQMYKILGINCLISAYSMSVLHSDGVKYGDKQMMMSGMVGAACFLLLSRSKPLDQLSSQRPITKVFHPYMMVSILGQFAIHFYSLATTLDMVMNSGKEHVEKALEQAKEVDDLESFKPSLLNTLVFMMTTIMTMTTFAVNYRGRPFMTGLFDNKPMIVAISIVTFIIFYCALEVDPEVNEMLEFVPMPSEEFKYGFVSLLACDVVGTFLVDRISYTVFVR